MITCWTCSGSMFERSSAAVMAMPPSSVGSTEARAPPILPIGVRAEPRITVLGMATIVGAPDLCAVTHSKRSHRVTLRTMFPSPAYEDAIIRIDGAVHQVARAGALAGEGRDAEAMSLLWDALPVLEREL